MFAKISQLFKIFDFFFICLFFFSSHLHRLIFHINMQFRVHHTLDHRKKSIFVTCKWSIIVGKIWGSIPYLSYLPIGEDEKEGLERRSKECWLPILSRVANIIFLENLRLFNWPLVHKLSNGGRNQVMQLQTRVLRARQPVLKLTRIGNIFYNKILRSFLN